MLSCKSLYCRNNDLKDKQITCADISGDGKLDIVDIVMLRSKIVNEKE